MCYPALIAAGMAAAGAGSNYMGAKRTNEARDDVARAHGERQAGLQGQADKIINQQTTALSPAAQNQSMALAGEQRLAAMPASSGAELPTSGSAPIEVKSELARQVGDAIRKSRTRLGTQARLGAANQVQRDNNLGMARSMSGLGQIADFSRGEAGVLPYELQGAANAGRSWQTAADLFNLGGQAVSLYGMTTPSATPGAKPAARPATTGRYQNPAPPPPRGSY